MGTSKVFDFSTQDLKGEAGTACHGEAALRREMLDIASERRKLLETGAVPGYAAVQQAEAVLPHERHIPLVGLGTWKAKPGEVHAAVTSALKAGYRHVDCAAVYNNEHEVGQALEEVFSEGYIGREEVFITSKLWNSEHAPERVAAACRKTLADLRLQQLDLYLMHWPSSLAPGPQVTPPLSDTWRAMEALVDEGLVVNIGVSNFSIPKLTALMRQARIQPAVLQVEAHPYFRNDALLAWCKQQGLHFTAYSPLGSPDSAAIMGRAAGMPGPMQDPVICGIAERLGKSAAQVMLRWGVQRGTSVLPKSVHPERIAANLDVFSWSLSEADMQAIQGIQTQVRMVPGQFLTHPAGPYRSLADLWDESTPGSL